MQSVTIAAAMTTTANKMTTALAPKSGVAKITVDMVCNSLAAT
jgi:hypothetical protein